MPTVYKEVEVDVEMCDFEDEDIMEEYDRRGLESRRRDDENVIAQLYEAYRNNRKELMDGLLREMFYQKLGRIA